MVSKELELLIQNTANSIIANYTETIGGVAVKIFKDYTCVIHSEIDYQFKEATPFLIEANLLYGAGTKNNDIEDKYSQNFVINIQSEVNGYEKAKTLFNLIFKALTRTYQTLGTYNCKLFLSSPVITNPFSAIESDYQVLMTMNGSLELAENIVLGATYELSLDGTNFITIKPRQPYELRESIGAMDTPLDATDDTTYTYSSNQRTFNLILLYEQRSGNSNSNFNALFNALLDDCENSSIRNYVLKVVVGNKTYTHNKLIMIRGQHIFDEATGENVLSMQFKKRT